ncbi:MAG: hypothetical protein FJ087_21225 [Deltaproteobacteria bacterium]|nr:hypothetical protein [Deltaproteobacteria bacterium]
MDRTARIRTAMEAAGLGPASTYVGGFEPVVLRDFLGLPAGEEPFAVLPVGRPKAP